MAKKGPKPTPLADRYWAKVDIRQADECWPWIAAADENGYGRIGVGSLGVDRRVVLATHAGWLLVHGAWPTLNVLHSCDNPACCNPSHWFEGTLADNNADMRAKGRQSGGERHSPFVRGEANGCALLTDVAVREIRASGDRLIDLAERFGVHYTTISDVRRRKSWRHVEEATT
jgi:hypothetical protein